MPSKDYIILSAVLIIVVACIAIPFCYEPNNEKPHDIYRYQSFNDSDITEVDSQFGKYVMTVAVAHDADVIIQKINGTERVSYLCINDPPMTGLGYTHMDKGKVYTIYFNKDISASEYHFLLHWKSK